MNRVLLDQGLSPRAAELLRTAGWDAIHVEEIGLSRADDIEILASGRSANRVCVTLDHDFHAHLARNQSGSPSVILIRVEGLSSEEQAVLIQTVWQKAALMLANGAAVTVDGRSIRIRPLPLK